jgi:hypothetical protein
MVDEITAVPDLPYPIATRSYTWNKWDEMWKWCIENAGEEWNEWSYFHTGSRDVEFTFHFKDPDVAMRFKLVWG